MPPSRGIGLRLFSKASTMHHDLKGAMGDNSLEHELIGDVRRAGVTARWSRGWGEYSK